MSSNRPPSLTDSERRRMVKWGSRPFAPAQWARRNLKPFRGLFIALGLVVVAFATVILWFALR